MSMALFFKALSQQELDGVLSGDLDFYEVGDRIDLDYYSMALMDYLPESDSPLFTLLTASEDFEELEENGVQFARNFYVDSIVDAFHETDLLALASEMGHDESEEYNQSISNSLYKVLENAQKFFEKAQADQKMVVGWVA